MTRSRHETAVQAVIFGTLGFRASLEVTDHPRSKSLCSQLLPWLKQLNFGTKIEPYHRESLETPHGEFPRDSQTEAYWRGEAAALLGWAIQLFDKPHSTRPVDPGALVQNLMILLPNASELISGSSLRPKIEIDDYCAFCLTMRHRFLASALGSEGQTAINNILQNRLAEFGLSDAFQRVNGAELESLLAVTMPSVQGLYAVRALAAEWLLGKGE